MTDRCSPDTVYAIVLRELEKKRLMPTSVMLATDITNAITAARSSAGSEPVAWRWIAKAGDVRWTFGAYAPSDAVKSQPLYTHALAQPSQEQK